MIEEVARKCVRIVSIYGLEKHGFTRSHFKNYMYILATSSSSGAATYILVLNVFCHLSIRTHVWSTCNSSHVMVIL